ncbi:recombinase family protein, partial [Lactococcus lactis subsp. lactis]|nr:recombinase family protein [Lactococcus lactis subsp. lactis]
AQGIAIAKQRGRFKGRKKKYSFEDEGLQHAFDLYQQGLTEKNKLILALLRAFSFNYDI